MTAKLVSAKEIAARYSVTAKTIRDWTRRKMLPVVRFNCRCLRFDIEKCDEAVAKRTRISRLSVLFLFCTMALLNASPSPNRPINLATEWLQNQPQREDSAFVIGFRYHILRRFRAGCRTLKALFRCGFGLNPAITTLTVEGLC